MIYKIVQMNKNIVQMLTKNSLKYFVCIISGLGYAEGPGRRGHMTYSILV